MTTPSAGPGAGLTPAMIANALTGARAMESRGWLDPGDWPAVAAALVAEGASDEQIAELAGLSDAATWWEVSPLLEALYERHHVPKLNDSDAVEVSAGLAFQELANRPSSQRQPLVRMLTRVALDTLQPTWGQAPHGVAVYQPCDCHPNIDPTWIPELATRPRPAIPDSVIAAIVAPLRRSIAE